MGRRQIRVVLGSLVAALAVVASVIVPAHAAQGTLQVTITIPGARGYEVVVRAYRVREDGTLQYENGRAARTAGEVATLSMPLWPGTFRICFDDDTPHYLPRVFIAECWDDAPDKESGTDVVIPDGGSVALAPELVLAHAPPGQVRGQVTAGGDPVPMFTARLYPVIDGTLGDPVVRDFDHHGPADGTYSMVVPDGRYRLCVEPFESYLIPFGDRFPRPGCWHTAASPDAADDIVVSGGAEVVADLALPWEDAASIAGTLTSTTPVGRVYITASPRPDQPGRPRIRSTSVTLDPGPSSYELTGLDPALTYTVCFSGAYIVPACWDEQPDQDAATPVTVTAGETRSGIDARLTAAGEIRGRITEAVYLAAKGRVRLTLYHRADDGWRQWGAFSGPPPHLGVAPPFDYAFPSLPPGRYRVCAHHQGAEFGIEQFERTCYEGGTSPADADVISVGGRELVTGINFSLGRYGTITGQVTGAGGPVRVELIRRLGRPAVMAATVTDDQGRYSFSVPGARYRLAFHREPTTTDAAAQYWDDVPDGSPLEATGVIALAAESTVTADATLRQGGVVAGRVTTADGSPVPDCTIRAHVPDDALAARLGTTGPAGRFEVAGLSTGAYRLKLEGGCGLASGDLYFSSAEPDHLTGTASRAEVLQVTLGDRVELTRPLGFRPPAPVGWCRGRSLQQWAALGYRVLVGTPGNDHLGGTSSRDVILAGAGDDTIMARGGRDVVCGGPGADTILGQDGPDALLGGKGSDLLRGGTGSDLLRGGRGPDLLYGGPGVDVLRGGPGRDRLIQ